MPPALNKTTVAVLRNIIEMTQEEFSVFVKVSRPTIQAIEIGKLKLSERLAAVISEKTGVRLGWLLDDDVTVPPVAIWGETYTKDTFAYHAGPKLVEELVGDSANLAITAFFYHVSRLYQLSHYSLQSEKTWAIINHRMRKFWQEQALEFGLSQQGMDGILSECDGQMAVNPKRLPQAMKSIGEAWLGEVEKKRGAQSKAYWAKRASEFIDETATPPSASSKSAPWKQSAPKPKKP